jgi:type II restriction/modification system DNA methylase subunit YeeA
MAQKITVAQFVEKWSKIQLKEKSASQSHFNDICALVGHATPTEIDPTGQFFTFEADVDKDTAGGRGWADAWYKDKFIWEYKGHRKQDKNLDAAYQQLLRYREFLGNPPLLITSDLQQIIIHTNFNNTIRRVEVIDFERLQKDGLPLLRDAFYNPEAFHPTETQEKVTEKTADSFLSFADELKKNGKRVYLPERLAHFIVRILFCLFAEDIGLLPNKVFTELVRRRYKDPTTELFTKSLRQLFAAMREGNSVFGADPIPWFNGGLFEDDFVPEVWGLHDLLSATDKNWAGIDPSIFGTLFERIIDESKRKQLGAHYTSKDDILLVIEPVLMAPLRAKWRKVQPEVEKQIKQGLSPVAYLTLKTFSEELAALKILDPACGSGNFLYLALRELLDLQKQVIVFAEKQALPEIALSVNPQQLYGLEINPYAHQLAQITVWIGYIQWRYENGFAEMQEPILRELKGIENRDAIFTPSLISPKSDEPPSNLEEVAEGRRGSESHWPPADVILGNPPFLGGKRMRSELGDEYVEALFSVYEGRVAHEADLVCYWFEKARAQLENNQLKRAGLLATNSIRGGANRKVLARIKESGDIFWAQSDHEWVLDGAAVNVSMVGFDKGIEKSHWLDGQIVNQINSDLTALFDLTQAKRLSENLDISFMGVTPAGPFTIPANVAQEWIRLSSKNQKVLKPYWNGEDITNKSRDVWVIDFGIDTTEADAKKFELPFQHIEKVVKPIRTKNNRGSYREKWWLFAETRAGMRSAIKSLTRYIVTPRVAKHRIFIWVDSFSLIDSATFLFAREDNYFFGVLHSKPHELWALRQGTSLEDRPRYTPTTTFETFPFPWIPNQEPIDDPRVQAIAAAAKALDNFRNNWLNPKDSLLQGSRALQKRTLTNLYNCLTVYREQIKGKHRSLAAWKSALRALFRAPDALAVELILSLDEVETLDEIHITLDQSVLEAYGWPHSLGDEQILERLLALNLERARQS